MTGLYTMRQAAKALGLGRDTFRRWLVESGFKRPRVARGSKILLTQADLDRVLATHSLQRRNFTS